MWAIKNATLHTVSNGTINNGTIIVEGTEIKLLGENLDVSHIEEVYDVSGKDITPGLIDVHTHLGIEEEIHPEGEDTNEMTNPITPELKALDGINFFDLGFRDALKGGVTTAMVTMGSSNVICGVTSVVKTAGGSINDQIINDVSGLKMAFGENPKRIYGKKGKSPQTRMAIMALARKAFEEALYYREAKKSGNVAYHHGYEHILLALDKKIPVRLHAHRADDIIQALNLRDEYNLDMVIEHCTDGEKIADILKVRHAKCAIGPAFVNRAKVEMENVSYSLGKAFEEKDILFSILTDHPVNPIGFFSICIGMYIREGLSFNRALRAVTLDAAEILACSDRIGSLESGKDADFVVWSEKPFTLMSKPEMVFIEGKRYI